MRNSHLLRPAPRLSNLGFVFVFFQQEVCNKVIKATHFYNCPTGVACGTPPFRRPAWPGIAMFFSAAANLVRGDSNSMSWSFEEAPLVIRVCWSACRFGVGRAVLVRLGAGSSIIPRRCQNERSWSEKSELPGTGQLYDFCQLRSFNAVPWTPSSARRLFPKPMTHAKPSNLRLNRPGGFKG